METEKIIFIIIALGFSILSMYLKAKRKKQASHQNYEESDHDFSRQEDFDYSSEPMVIFEQNNVFNSPQEVNIYPKKSSKKQKAQKIEAVAPPVQNPEKILQNDDLEDKTVLLGDFEGTEIQKAFLFSEIFKNTKN